MVYATNLSSQAGGVFVTNPTSQDARTHAKSTSTQRVLTYAASPSSQHDGGTFVTIPSPQHGGTYYHTMLNTSMACFVVAGVLFLATVVMWVVMCRRYRIKQTLSLKSTEVEVKVPIPPPRPPESLVEEPGNYIEFESRMNKGVSSIDKPPPRPPESLVEEPGNYIEFESRMNKGVSSIDKYDTVVERTSNIPCDLPRDSMYETFDGSRMPSHPPPPPPTGKPRVDDTIEARVIESDGHVYDDVKKGDPHGTNKTSERTQAASIQHKRPPTLPGRRQNEVE